MKENITAIFLITIASVLISLPLVAPGLHVIHDDQQVARLFVFDQALKAGQFPVRWVDGLGFGFGYPLFVFYPPLVYYLGEAFHLLGFGFINSIKLVFALGFLLSGVAMYILAKEFFGKLPGAVASLFYLLVPYRALDVYVRGALAESFSFVFPPLILWAFYKLAKTHVRRYLYLSAILLSLLMITHNLIFLPFMLILPFYLLFLLRGSSAKRQFAVLSLLSFILAFALSAFFWLPALLEKKFTIVDELLLVNLANYNIHFVYPHQLWNWTWGFGGSAAGLADGISFKIGKLHVLVSASAFLLAAAHLIRKSKFSLTEEKVQLIMPQISILIICLFILSAFMTTFYSKFIWDLIPPLGYLQFPWRFLTFTGLFGSLSAGAAIYLLRLPILKLVAAVAVVTLLFIPNYKLFKPQSYRLDLTDQIATAKDVINWQVSSSSFDYLPRGVELYTSSLGTNVVKIDQQDIPDQKVAVLSQEAYITNLQSSPEHVRFDLQADQKSHLRVNIFNFPGWILTIDGVKTAIDDNNRLKLITFETPAGAHQVELKFKNTPVRTLANFITAAAAVIMIVAIWQPKFKQLISKKS